MPLIPYKADRFDAYPPTGKLPANQAGQCQTGYVSMSMTDLASYAIGVGDTAVLGTGHSRPRFEIVWRDAMARSSLDIQCGFFVKSPSYERMDPSEKTAVSYFLGMAQCAALADLVLGARVTVHVDSFLSLLGAPLPKTSRPDLVGYNIPPTGTSPGRFLLEAKGRTGGFSRAVVDSALDQLKQPLPLAHQLVSANPIHVASLAYFKTAFKGGPPVWHSYLEDPPPPNNAPSYDLGDDEYCGLVLLSQLFPVYRAMSSLGELSQQFTISHEAGLTTTRLPIEGVRVGIPTVLYSLLSTIDSPLRNQRQREDVARAVWELATQSDYPAQFAELESPDEDLSVLSSGLSLFTPTQDGTQGQPAD